MANMGLSHTLVPKLHTDSYRPRILRLYEVTDFSVHDFVLVDCKKLSHPYSSLLTIRVAPQYHLTLDTCTNGEVYNMVVRGGNEGGLDGFDIWGTNIWVHDVEVTNKDECVTVKVRPRRNTTCFR